MNQQFVFNVLSLHRNTHKSGFLIKWLTKMLQLKGNDPCVGGIQNITTMNNWSLLYVYQQLTPQQQILSSNAFILFIFLFNSHPKMCCC